VRLDPTPEGLFRTRLRYGKGLRGRFLIKLRDEAAAEGRAVAQILLEGTRGK
jgi:hypothetical protein